MEKVKKPIYKKWWFWVLIVIILVIGIGSSGDSKNNTIQTSTSTEQKSQVKQEEVMEVDYTSLHQDYMDNPISADAKYKGKI